MAIDSFPIDGIYAQQQAAAERLYQQSLTQIAAKKQSILQQYGYTPDYHLDNGNPYGAMQEIAHNYDYQKGQIQQAQTGLDQSRGQFARDYGVSLNPDNSGYTVDPNADGVFSRLSSDHTTLLSRLAQTRGNYTTDYNTTVGRINTTRDNLQRDYGLRGSFDSDMNPQGQLQVGDNQHGLFQNMLYSQADSLKGLQEDALGRGLGATGLGAKGVASASLQQAGDRSNLKQGLIDRLVDQANQQHDETTGYNRALTGLDQQTSDENTSYNRRYTDTDRAISDALTGFGNQSKQLTGDLTELGYQRGLQESSAQQALQAALAEQNMLALLARQGRSDSASQGPQRSPSEAAAAPAPLYVLPRPVYTMPSGRKVYESSPGGRGGV